MTALQRASSLWIISISSFFWTASGQSPSTASILWYKQPAPIWTEALPIGNGRTGAMVFGGGNTVSNNGDLQDNEKNAEILHGDKTRAQDEHLQLNDSTLWQGSRQNLLNPRGHEGFVTSRALLLSSGGTDSAKITEAEKLLDQTMLSNPRRMPGYSTLGDLYLRSTETDAATNYRRQLDLESGIVRISYTAHHVEYVREVFASAPDHVLVMHLTASHANALSFQIQMDRPKDFQVHPLNDTNLALSEGPAHTDQIHFQGQVRVLAKGGSVKAHGNSIDVVQANEVTLLIATATDFEGGSFHGGSPAVQCQQTLDRASQKSYLQLQQRATNDLHALMSRVHFQLGAPNASLEALPTDERIRRVSAGGDDLGLQSLYFRFGRYLLIGSSRPGGTTANLQGLWASGIDNPWGSKYTININIEMNYWMAESANLSELQLPLFDLLDMVRTPGSGTGTLVAQKYYNARGFVIHHNTDLWGDAHPVDRITSGIWPTGGAWMTLHAWDHYAYTNDTEFLRTRAWPLLYNASLFFLDYLTDDGHGHLVTGPSLSPENRYKMADGSEHSITMGPTMDIEIVRELFLRTLQAGAILHTDPAFQQKVQNAMDRLAPFKIGHLGNLQEWQLDYDDAAPGHRHISHLWALYPGNQISPLHTPELAKAAQTTLETRLKNGGGQTGWSRAWVVNYWDHLRNGDQAYDSMQVLFRQSTFPNMMDTHPPGVFQIDGNLGAANGMLEALVQSRWYPDHTEVDLVPALPHAWTQGDVSGIRIRGGGELHLQWKNGTLTSTTWQCTHSGLFDLRLADGTTLQSIHANGKPVASTAINDHVTRIAMTQGITYTLTF